MLIVTVTNEWKNCRDGRGHLCPILQYKWSSSVSFSPAPFVWKNGTQRWRPSMRRRKGSSIFFIPLAIKIDDSFPSLSLANWSPTLVPLIKWQFKYCGRTQVLKGDSAQYLNSFYCQERELRATVNIPFFIIKMSVNVSTIFSYSFWHVDTHYDEDQECWQQVPVQQMLPKRIDKIKTDVSHDPLWKRLNGWTCVTTTSWNRHSNEHRLFFCLSVVDAQFEWSFHDVWSSHRPTSTSPSTCHPSINQ